MTNTNERYIQVYTGNGKGKTTAALGQALRGAGSGLKTFIVMFMKDYPYGEVKSLKKLSEWITVEQYGNDKFVFRNQPPSDKDRAIARQALDRVREVILSSRYDIVILDEICVAVYFSLLPAEDVLRLLDEKPKEVELILTGRYCPQEWIDRADLVTEMREVKHYYQKGVVSRKGFER
jgi:cob(I)alamin adenosyltransferase